MSDALCPKCGSSNVFKWPQFTNRYHCNDCKEDPIWISPPPPAVAAEKGEDYWIERFARCENDVETLHLAQEVSARIAELERELAEANDKRKETAKDFETAFRVVRQENDQLRNDRNDMKRLSELNTWVPADSLVPMGPHDVLCTDLEFIWVGIYENDEWKRDDLPVDAVVTHWMELPELPEHP